MRCFPVLSCVVLTLAISYVSKVSASIEDSLGNASPELTVAGFVDNALVTVPEIAQVQQAIPSPAPFDIGYGSDNIPFIVPLNFDQMWQHDLGGPITDPILSATLTFGIADHDSAASGDQVSLFSIDGNNNTTLLNSLFNAAGEGTQTNLGSQYDVYSIDLLSMGLGGSLLDGILDVQLTLQPNSLVFNLFGPDLGLQESNVGNGAFLIFSTLDVETDTGGGVIPEQQALVVWSMLGVMGLVYVGRRRKKAAIK
jgi:hypothetical protein